VLLKILCRCGKPEPQQIAAQGGNRSLIHLDWMIGSDKTDIDRHSPRWPQPAGVPQGRWA